MRARVLTGPLQAASICGGGALTLSEDNAVRKVEIVQEPNQKIYKWIAVDKKTNQPLLRLADLSQMHDVCHRLEWKVVDVKSTRLQAVQ